MKERVQQHYYKGAIRTHGQDCHNRRFSKIEIFENTKVIKKDLNSNNLRILEAILIKERRPKINLKDEGFVRTLRIFWNNFLYKFILCIYKLFIFLLISCLKMAHVCERRNIAQNIFLKTSKWYSFIVLKFSQRD